MTFHRKLFSGTCPVITCSVVAKRFFRKREKPRSDSLKHNSEKLRESCDPLHYTFASHASMSADSKINENRHPADC